MDPIDTLGLDHVELTVNDLARATAFYETVLGALGFRRVPGAPHPFFSNAHTSVGLNQAPLETRGAAFDRWRVGLHHLALRARSREDVDRFHTFLVETGITVLDPPAEYPQYGPGYYAVFFSDPDGLKLELVHHPWGYWRRVMTDGRDDRPRLAG